MKVEKLEREFRYNGGLRFARSESEPIRRGSAQSLRQRLS